MKLYILPWTDIYTGLATEEYLFDQQTEEICILWRSSPAVIVGKYQDIHQEVNIDYVTSRGISIARRSTGGGTVYHDAGNLNICFISNKALEHAQIASFQIQAVLDSLGIESFINSRLALHTKGYKISGSAQRLYKERAMFHATLLFSSDLNSLNNAITPSREQLNSPTQWQHKVAIPSCREPVGNLKVLFNLEYDIEAFIQLFSKQLQHLYSAQRLELSDEAKKCIKHIVTHKHTSKEWIHQGDYNQREIIQTSNNR